MVILSLIIYLIVTFPLLGVFYLLRKLNRPLIDKISFAMLSWIAGVMVFCSGARLHIKGQENIPSDQSVLYVSNHRSYFDILICLSLCKRITGFVAKKELGRIPSLNIWMSRIYCVFLDRDDVKAGMQVILKSAENIKNGFSMFIYPEGHRFHDSFLHEFKAGSFKIATKTNCPIIPVAIYGSDDIFENHVPYVRAVDVYLEYGAPIIPNDLDPDDKKHIAIYVQNKISTMLSNVSKDN